MTNHYYAELQGHAPLSPSEERKLLERLKQEPSAADRALLVTSNLRFTVSIAQRYRGCGVPLDDLVNEGNIGLIEAAQRYDPERGTRFLTYAIWWIRKSILAAIADQSLIRIPQYRQKQLKGVREREQALDGRREPAGGKWRREAISETIEALDELLKGMPRSLSLLDMVDEDSDRPVDDLIADRTAVSPELRMLEDESDEMVVEAIGHLSPMERKIIRGRFGMGDDQPKALKELAREVGLSRERVRQIELQAKGKIRRRIVRQSRARSTSP